jgi:hypothetical protein
MIAAAALLSIVAGDVVLDLVSAAAPPWQVAIALLICLGLQVPLIFRMVDGGAGKARAFAGLESPCVPHPPRFTFPRRRP